MASPQMVDIKQLSPQQLTEVSQQIEQELTALTVCHKELLSVRKKFIAAREAVNDIKGTEGEPIMVPLTGSLYTFGKLSNKDFIVDIGTNYYVEKNHDETVKFFDRKLKYLEENMEKVSPQVQQKKMSKMMIDKELVEKMRAVKLARPSK